MDERSVQGRVGVEKCISKEGNYFENVNRNERHY